MWLKNLRYRKLHTIMIFLIIAICTTLLTGAMSILTSLEKPCFDFAKTCHTATAKVFTHQPEDKAVYSMGRQFTNLSIVKKVAYARSHFVDENLLINNKKADIFVDLTEYNDKIFRQTRYLEGNKKIGKTLTEQECILPACISNEYDVHIGDKITVKLVDKDVTYKVAAVFTDPFQTSTAFDSNILVKKLPKVKSNLDIYVYGKADVTGQLIEEAYREKYNGMLQGSVYTIEDRINNGLVVGKIIGAIFLAIGIIMLLVSGLMIHYMIKNVMLTDAKSIAVFKTIGYTSNDILFMYVKLFFCIVTLACFVGSIASNFISNTILTSIYENMGQLKVNHTIQSGVICYLLTVSFVISVITIILSKSKKIKPVLALGGINYGGIKKKKKYKGNSKLQFSAMGIAFRTFVREKRNAVSILITCIVTIFSINFAVISLDAARTMKDNNDFWLGVDKADVMVNVTDPTQFDFVKNIVKKDDRTDYSLYSNYLARVTMRWEKGMNSTSMSAFVYDDYTKAKLPVIEGRNPKTGNEIAISTTVAGDLNKSIGDYISVYLDGKVQTDMLITGLFQSYMQFGEMCRLTTSAYKEHNYKLVYNNISVYLKNKKDTNRYIKDMKSKIDGSGNVIKRTQQYGSIMDMIANPQLKAVPPVSALILIIAGLNIFSIVYLKNMKAQKINGIYKCIGYTTWHLIFSNMIYVTVIAIVSVIITLPISVLTYSSIMKMSLAVFNFKRYPVQYNYFHLIGLNLVVVLIFIISTLLSSKALFKVNARNLVNE